MPKEKLGLGGAVLYALARVVKSRAVLQVGLRPASCCWMCRGYRPPLSIATGDTAVQGSCGSSDSRLDYLGGSVGNPARNRLRNGASFQSSLPSRWCSWTGRGKHASSRGISPAEKF